MSSFTTTHISEKAQKGDYVGNLEMKVRTLASVKTDNKESLLWNKMGEQVARYLSEMVSTKGNFNMA